MSSESISDKVARLSQNMPKGYITKDETIFRIVYKDKVPTEEKLCDFMAVEKLTRDASTYDQIITLLYKSGADGFLEKDIPAGQINTKTIEELQNYGVDINSQNKNQVNKYLNESRKLLKSEIHYKEVGWITLDDKQVFATDRVITPPNLFPNSKLDGDLNLTPHGKHYRLDDKASPIYHDIMENVNLQLALCLGLSASILPVLRKKVTDLNSMIYSLTGFSSSGKTTAAKLALSVAGKPSGEGSLFGTWSSTSNAISARLNYDFGIPQLFDELSEFRGKNLTTVIYNISDGKEKHRLRKDGTQQPSKFWCTAVISTSETSLLEKTSSNDGLFNRVLELTNVEWTSSAEQSNRIKLFAENNNGYWINDFITSIYGKDDLPIGDKKIFAIYMEMEKEAEKLIVSKEFKARLASRVAVIGTTAELVNKYLNFPMDANVLQKHVVKKCGLDIENDLGERGYNDLLSELVKMQNDFALKGSSNKNYGDVKGYLNFDKQKGTLIVDVLYTVTKGILNDLGYEEPDQVLRLLKSKGYVNGQDSHLTKRTSVNGKRIKFISVNIPKTSQGLFLTVNGSKSMENFNNSSFQSANQTDSVPSPTNPFSGLSTKVESVSSSPNPFDMNPMPSGFGFNENNLYESDCDIDPCDAQIPYEREDDSYND